MFLVDQRLDAGQSSSFEAVPKGGGVLCICTLPGGQARYRLEVERNDGTTMVQERRVEQYLAQAHLRPPRDRRWRVSNLAGSPLHVTFDSRDDDIGEVNKLPPL